MTDGLSADGGFGTLRAGKNPARRSADGGGGAGVAIEEVRKRVFCAGCGGIQFRRWID